MKDIIPTLEDFLDEDFAMPAASLQNTPGMGNVSMPDANGKTGSGDTFGGIAKKKKKRKKLAALPDNVTSRDMTINGN